MVVKIYNNKSTKCYTQAEALSIVGCASESLRQYRRRGEVAYIKEGQKDFFYPAESLDAFAKVFSTRKPNALLNNISKATEASKKAKKEKDLLRREIELLAEQRANKIYYFSEDYHGREGFIQHRPHPKQKMLFDAWDNPQYKVFVFYGGNRSGKTTAEVIIIIREMIGYWPWERPKNLISRPKVIRWVGQGWETHIKSVISKAMKEWWPACRPITTRKNNNGIIFWYEDVETGSTLEILSNKSEADAFEGWKGDAVFYDEPPRRDVRIACARGLVDSCGKELIAATLIKEPWIDQEIVRNLDAEGNPDSSVFSIISSIYENLGYGITKEGIEQFAKTLKPEEVLARLHGRPSYLSGLVYPEFDASVHVVPRFRVPPDWIVDVACDTHTSIPHAISFLATTSKNVKYLIAELWMQGDGAYIAATIVRFFQKTGFRPGVVLLDPLAKADKNAGSLDGLSMLSTFDKVQAGLSPFNLEVYAASKSKATGILEVRNLLKPFYAGDETPLHHSRPELYFFDNCLKSKKEIEGWGYDDNGFARKKDDHFMENLYRLVLLDTQWYPMEEDIPTETPYVTNNRVTGY